MRINRFLAAAGLGSRRKVEELVRAGRVSVNGLPCTDLARTVAAGDEVRVGGRAVRPLAFRYVVLNKPRGYVCTAADERGRPTIYGLLPPGWPRLAHVGRLDRDSEGLLLLTNDGGLALQLAHPRHAVDKEYAVTIDRPFDPAHAARLCRGFRIEPGFAKAAAVRQTGPCQLRIILRQGLKRQVRLMLAALGYRVRRLCRIRLGNLRLAGLAPGAWRHLTPRDLADLRAAGEPSDRAPAASE